MSGRMLMRHRSAWVLVMTPILAMAGLAVAVSSQAAVARPATLATAVASHASGDVAPNRVNRLDCNGYSTKYKSLDPAFKSHCTDPLATHTVRYDGKKATPGYRFEATAPYRADNEPRFKLTSHASSSTDTMT